MFWQSGMGRCMLGSQGLCRGVSFLFSEALIEGRAINGFIAFGKFN